MEDSQLPEIVTALQRRGKDSSKIEAKAAGRDLNKDVWDSVSAFANTDGGIILLGLNESNNFTLTEGFDSTKISDKLRAGLENSPKANAKVSPIPDFILAEHEYENGYIVSLEIFPFHGRIDAPGPCFVTSKGITRGSYKRVGDADKLLNDYEIYQIRQRLEQPVFDIEPVPGTYLNELEPNNISKTLRAIRNSQSRALAGLSVDDISGALRRINVISKTTDEVTFAGLLTLGYYPQQEYPQLTIDVTAHPGTEKSLDPTVRFIDRQNCDGPIPEAVQNSINAVLRNLRTRREIIDVQGRDVPEIPVSTLREAITNAVLHRDYSPYVRGQQIAVDIFTDRVEITSPGGFWGSRTKENIIEGISNSRNSALARLLNIVPMPDGESKVAENQGSGVLRMLQEMRENGLPAPDYSASTLTQVVVKLYRFGLLDPQINTWLETLPKTRSLSTNERIVLALAYRNKYVNVSDLRRNLGIDSDDARALLDSLVNTALIRGDGDGPYSLATVLLDTEITPAQSEVLEALSYDTPLKVHDISIATQRTANALRPILRELIEMGLVKATAPAQSRHRAYLRSQSPHDTTN